MRTDLHIGVTVVVVTREDAENYRFSRLYSIDLEMAKQSCDLLARQNDLELRYCILRDIVVTYSRPFSKNLGRVYRKHALAEDAVPAAMRGLHTELLKLRDQAFAHTDHDFRNPQIARFPREGGAGLYSMSFRNPSYEDLNTRLPEIRELVVAVEQCVNTRAREFELTFDQLYPEELKTVPESDSHTPGA